MVKSLFAAAVALVVLPSFAVDYIWTGEAGNGKWRDAGNWSGGDGTAYPSVRPSAVASGDTATFPSGEVTLTDSPANCGLVTVSAGAVVAAPISGSITWHGLRGPGRFVKQGEGVLYLCNDATDGRCLYGGIVFQAEAGGVGLTGDGGTSILATSGEFSNAKTTPTIADATIIMKNDANLSRGGSSWPGVYGTVTVDVEEGLSSGKFLSATAWSSAESKIIKTGGGTLDFNAELTTQYAKGALEIREGEIRAAVRTFELTGELSGGGILSATNLIVRASNDLFTGTIAFREKGSSALVYAPCGLVNASVEVATTSCNLSFNARNGRMFNPISVPEGKTLTISSLGGGITHFFGLGGPGKVIMRTPNGSGWLYL